MQQIASASTHRRALAQSSAVLCALAALSFGCSSSSASGGAPPGSGGAAGGGACPSPGPYQFAITDDTNYSFASMLDIGMTTLKDNTDLSFDWSSLKTDIYGKAVDPAADIDLVLVSLWNLKPAELVQTLNHDMLDRGANEGALMTYPDGTFTSQNLLSFGVLGNPVPDPQQIWSRFDTSQPGYAYPQDQHTFLVMASTGTTIGVGARTLALFNLDPSSTQTALTLGDDTTSLSFQADLMRAKPVPVPAGQPSLTIDWGMMTTNGLGNMYTPTQITKAAVAHFATSSLAELQTQFLDLEQIAQGWWSGPVLAGESIDLGTLTDANSATFPGVDSSGTWLVALFCTSGCNNPAPWSVTILSACQ